MRHHCWKRAPLAAAAAVAACVLLPAAWIETPAAPPAPDDAMATIVMKNGSSITGEILRKRADQVVVDVGFDLIVVPAGEIERIERVAQERKTGEPSARMEHTLPAAKAASSRGALFRIDPAREEMTLKENVERCGPAVLQVMTPIGLGSGFVIHPEGFVVTNHHVISGENDITLTMFESGERELRHVAFENVRIVALNPHLDLALLKIEDLGDRELPVIPMGDSGALRQGQTVFSIGSPLGMDRTVSQGIVSLKNRPLDGHLFVQSTVQLNPGNSGGPLLNLRGELVGINNMKISALGVEGMGFSIPSSVLRDFLDNRDAFAFDARNPNAGFRYPSPTSDLGGYGIADEGESH